MTADVKDIGAARKKSNGAKKPAALADWQRGLIVSQKTGAPKASIANVLHVLARHPAWDSVIAYDQFSERIVKLRPPPVRDQDAPEIAAAGDWTESDVSRTSAWFASVIGFEPAAAHVYGAVAAIAEKQIIHPVRDWLAGLKWDSKPRLDSLLSRYFGAADNPYTRAIGARFAIGAVARVMRPGCKVDTVLVLEGPQGGRKSSGWRALTSDAWFLDTGLVIGDKDTYQSLHGKWIAELAELSALKGATSIERTKAFLSSPVDRYRPSYARATRDFPRQCVFVASTNESHYLVDPTGNRRFWPAKCGAIDLDAIRRDREALWAEAVVRFHADEHWYLDTPELVELAQGEQRTREHVDDWLPLASAWLERPTVPVLGTEREREPIDIEQGVTTLQVLLGAVGLTPDKLESRHTTRAGHVLRSLGWEPRQVRCAKDWTVRERRYFRPASHAETEGVTEPVTSEAPVNKPTSHVTGSAPTHTHTRAPGSAPQSVEPNQGGTPGTCDAAQPRRITLDPTTGEVVPC